MGLSIKIRDWSFCYCLVWISVGVSLLPLAVTLFSRFSFLSWPLFQSCAGSALGCVGQQIRTGQKTSRTQPCSWTQGSPAACSSPVPCTQVSASHFSSARWSCFAFHFFILSIVSVIHYPVVFQSISLYNYLSLNRPFSYYYVSSFKERNGPSKH